MISEKEFDIEIVTPECSKFKGRGDELILPGVMGEVAILAGHAPIMTMLNPGILQYEDKQGWHRFACGGGFATIADNKATCLVDFALSAEEIDKASVEEEIRELTEALQKPGANEFTRERLKAANAKLRIFGDFEH